MDAIEVSGLSKQYPPERRDGSPIVAVDGITFSVRRSEVFGFLGPNGAGKTTTVRMLTTLVLPSAGRATLMGHDVIRRATAARSCLGIVPETSNVYDEFSAWDNLIFAARLYGLDRRTRETRTEELLRSFRLWERRHHRAAGFSKGMKRRLCLAMGLVHRPQVLFLDEPTSGLDVESTLEIRHRIQKLKASGTTVFLTTHNMDEASRVCDRVAVIHRGAIAAIDTPTALRTRLRSTRTVEVAFEAGSIDQSHLACLPAVLAAQRLAATPHTWRLETRDASVVLTGVVELARSRGATIASLNTIEPTLEEVFLHLTGSAPGVPPRAGVDGRGQADA